VRIVLVPMNNKPIERLRFGIWERENCTYVVKSTSTMNADLDTNEGF